ncbi:hypothetical protein HY946_00225 [Candidatus Gottesmanbacteria bacterium]|nr:hypothetical protein [Candidatus Gottesmanbacteria bacterium]
MNLPKIRLFISLLFGLVILVLIGEAGYYFWVSRKQPPVAPGVKEEIKNIIQYPSIPGAAQETLASLPALYAGIIRKVDLEQGMIEIAPLASVSGELKVLEDLTFAVNLDSCASSRLVVGKNKADREWTGNLPGFKGEISLGDKIYFVCKKENLDQENLSCKSFETCLIEKME